jgi:hypothetical protein
MTTTPIPADIAGLLRQALYGQLHGAFEDAPCGLPEEHSRRGWTDVLARIDDTRAALDMIGWDAPARQHAVEVELDRAMIDALQADADTLESIAEAVTTETAQGRRRAAATAKTIKRFLASVKPSGGDA